MVALILAAVTGLWTADNHQFLRKVTDAAWEYVGLQERQPGRQADGAEAVTLEADGRTFILFKQMPPEAEAAAQEPPVVVAARAN
ncbi:MAG: hypothetical protein OXR84_03030 [Magnetovibrio sp.]|nr:hypothetical protein [Magnetovibrio sp.]